MTQKKTTRKTAGRPNKVNELCEPKNWERIVDYTEYMMSREAICKFMDCNKDTLLKAIKKKGFKDFQDLKEHCSQNVRYAMKKQVFDEIKNGTASDKIKIYYLENYVLPFEEHMQEKQEETNSNTIVYIPVADFADPQKLQAAAQKQQEDLEDRINQHMRENNID